MWGRRKKEAEAEAGLSMAADGGWRTVGSSGLYKSQVRTTEDCLQARTWSVYEEDSGFFFGFLASIVFVAWFFSKLSVVLSDVSL